MKHLKTVEEMQKGDLYLKFDIVFPKKIKHHFKQAISAALRANEEEFE
jgi:DnaJ-class molecular chaperone